MSAMTSFKEIFVPLFKVAEDEAALTAAEALARRNEGHVTALMIEVPLASHLANEAAPLSSVVSDLIAGSQSEAEQEYARLKARLARCTVPIDARQILAEEAIMQSEAVAHARCADLSVLTHSVRGEGPARGRLLERILFGAGRPVLLTPRAWSAEGDLGQRILIGWNAKREAARAVDDALPLLRQAREVAIVTIDALPRMGGHAEAPGADLAAYLARHGMKCVVRNVDGMGRSEAHALKDEVAAFGADLIVMGAYGHMRAREFLFGGVTRELLSAPPTPLFLSH